MRAAASASVWLVLAAPTPSRGSWAWDNILGLPNSFDIQTADLFSSNGRRRLDVLSVWGTEMGNLAADISSGTISSAAGVLVRAQSASCDGSEPNIALVDGIVASLLPQINQAIRPTARIEEAVIGQAFRCLCTGSWNVGTSAWTVAYTVLESLLRGSDPIPTANQLVSALRGVVPELLSATGLCSTECYAALEQIVPTILALLVSQPAFDAHISRGHAYRLFPGEAVGCMCGGSVDWSAVVGFVGDTWAGSIRGHPGLAGSLEFATSIAAELFSGLARPHAPACSMVFIHCPPSIHCP